MQYFNKRVKPQLFKVGNFVLREVGTTTKKQEKGKVRPRWIGPYMIVKSNVPYSYHLEDMNEERLTQPWNS